MALAFVQHLLGLVTTALTYALGRASFGRLSGLVGGLAAALSGPLLVYEQHVMSETLFTFTLVLCAFSFVLAARHRRDRPSTWSGGRHWRWPSWPARCPGAAAAGTARVAAGFP